VTSVSYGICWRFVRFRGFRTDRAVPRNGIPVTVAYFVPLPLTVFRRRSRPRDLPGSLLRRPVPENGRRRCRRTAPARSRRHETFRKIRLPPPVGEAPAPNPAPVAAVPRTNSCGAGVPSTRRALRPVDGGAPPRRVRTKGVGCRPDRRTCRTPQPATRTSGKSGRRPVVRRPGLRPNTRTDRCRRPSGSTDNVRNFRHPRPAADVDSRDNVRDYRRPGPAAVDSRDSVRGYRRCCRPADWRDRDGVRAPLQTWATDRNGRWACLRCGVRPTVPLPATAAVSCSRQ